MEVTRGAIRAAGGKGEREYLERAFLFKNFPFIYHVGMGQEMWSRGVNVATTAHVEIRRQHHVSGIELGSSRLVASTC